jgi:hypothetical protein
MDPNSGHSVNVGPLIEAKSRSTRTYPRAPNSGYKTASNSCSRCRNFNQLLINRALKTTPNFLHSIECMKNSLWTLWWSLSFVGGELIIYFQLLGTNVFPELVCPSLQRQYYLDSYYKRGSLDCSISRATCFPSFFVCIDL